MDKHANSAIRSIEKAVSLRNKAVNFIEDKVSKRPVLDDLVSKKKKLDPEFHSPAYQQNVCDDYLDRKSRLIKGTIGGVIGLEVPATTAGIYGAGDADTFKNRALKTVEDVSGVDTSNCRDSRFSQMF